MNPPELLDRLLVSIKWLGGAVAALTAGSMFGSHTVLVGLVALMAIDWVTGFNRAFIAGAVSSEAGARGLVKKGQILLLILALHVAEKLSGYEVGAELWGAGGFCINELISIVENVSQSGVYIPQAIVDGLLRVKSLRPRAATRADLDKLRDDNRAEVDVAIATNRVETDAAVTASRKEVDHLAEVVQALPTVGK